MRLLSLEIHNFRGIKDANINFNTDNRLLCLIGAGDSTKSTILLSIKYLFYSSWNLPICDNDFYLSKTENDIVIQGTICEIPKSLTTDNKFGLLLRKPYIEYDRKTNDEPEDDKAICLTIQLTVNSSLEPRWNIICNRCEPKPISGADRSKLATGFVGDNCGKDLSWGRYSVLQKYADSKGELHDAYIKIMREITSNVDLTKLDSISSDIKKIGEHYGVGFENEINTKLSFQNGSFNTCAYLFDGHVPVNLRGCGSQRLLSMGLNIAASQDGTVLLIDEIEHGLEPYRLRSLINEIRKRTKNIGQVIITTHSPVVLTECDVSELAVVFSNNGKTDIRYFKTTDSKINDQLQKQIRTDADAFLCKSLIVCEGKTEQGFIKAFDDYVVKEKGMRIAHKGIGIALGCGENTFSYAYNLKECGYNVSIFMDSDKKNEDEKKLEAKKQYNIKIFDWDSPNSIEEQLFLDLPETQVQQLIDIAVEEKGLSIISSVLKTEKILFESVNNKIILKTFDKNTRKTLGTLAKKKSKNGHIGEWFKRIDLGREIGNVTFNNFSEIGSKTKLHQTIFSIIDWVTQI